MQRVLSSLGAAVVLSAVSIFAGPVLAQSNPTIMVMAEDGDTDGVPRRSRISTRILNELVTQLHSAGYDVYDETAVTVDTHVQGRSDRTDAEIIDIAKSVRRPPIDIAVFFTVFDGVTRKTYANEMSLRVAGRLLNVHDGRRLGNWEEVVPDRWNLPNRCFPGGTQGPSRECILEAVGGDARKVAQAVGSVLVEMLDRQISSVERGRVGTDSGSRGSGSDLKRAYVLEFDGFTDQDMMDIEEFLVVFSGYVDHRPTSSVGNSHEVWYESTIETGRLKRNLSKMVDILNMPSTLRFSGNKFTLRKKNFRQQRTRDQIRDLYKW